MTFRHPSRLQHLMTNIVFSLEPKQPNAIPVCLKPPCGLLECLKISLSNKALNSLNSQHWIQPQLSATKNH